MDQDTRAPTEDVLERLDALLNRDKAASATVTLNEPPNIIPLLTEIYQPALAQTAQSTVAGVNLSLSSEHIEQIVKLLLPELSRIMQDALNQHIQPALEMALRDRLTVLAQQKPKS